MTSAPLQLQRRHLTDLLEASRRCAWFLIAADGQVPWQLNAEILHAHRKDVALFGALSTINERFAKLQDTVGSAILSSEPMEPFLKTLAFYEKVGVLESTALWQQCRLARNEAAHTYDTDYEATAEHFNTLHELQPILLRIAARFETWCGEALGVDPATDDFSSAFQR